MLQSEFAKLSAEEKQKTLQTLLSSNGTFCITSQIRYFEKKYGMSSDQMLIANAKGTIEETTEIEEWIFLLQCKDK